MNYKVTLNKPFGVIIEPTSDKISVKEVGIKSLRELFRQEHLLLFRGFKTFKHADEFSEYCELWGEVSLWPFGKVLELVEHSQPQDHIFDNSYIPLHWDGMYRPQVPEYQAFHCVKAPLATEGGRTTFSNTILALEHASPELIALWKKVTGVYQRSMAFYNSKTVSPIITKHPQKDILVIRYNEPHSSKQGHLINPPIVEFTGVPQQGLENFHQGLKQALYNRKNFYAHEWQEGDVVIADNFSLLHGREKFVSQSARHIRRVHVLSNPPFDNPALVSYK